VGFAFAPHINHPVAKPKEPFFAHPMPTIPPIIQTVFELKTEIGKILNLSLQIHFKMT
jgi:hypothetical protein